jgi:hypothetical protein
MATSGPTQLPAFFNTDADFRTWCQGIAAALVACGLVKTGDTGQIDNTTVAKPAAINTAQGYEIYRFADTLQATRPVYIKIEYGSGGAASRPGLWVTTGTGTTGAGTLTGQVGTRTQIRATSDKTAGATLPVYASGAQSSTDSRIVVALNQDLATPNVNYGFGFVIERLPDSSGTPTGDGIWTYYWTPPGSSTCFSQVIPTPSGAVPSGGIVPPIIAAETAGGNSAFGGDVAMQPPIVSLGKAYVLTGVLTYNNPDLGAGASVTVSLYGATRTYMPLGGANKGTDRAVNGGANSTHAIRWE